MNIVPRWWRWSRTIRSPPCMRWFDWRIIDLCQWLWEEYEVTVSKQTLSRELRAMGYRKLSARPRPHAQAAGAVKAFKKTGQRQWQRSRVVAASIPPT